MIGTSFRTFILLLALAKFVAPASSAAAPSLNEEPPPPRLCLGYDPERKTWGVKETDHNRSPIANCPSGFAALAHDIMVNSSHAGPSGAGIALYCCPLPEGVLLDEHRYVDESCPSNFVVTGSKLDFKSPTGKMDRFLFRCTKIDVSKYELSAREPGWFIGWAREIFGDYFKILTSTVDRHTTWNRIPAGLRFGILRKHQSEWEPDGCIGYPWGGILVERHGNNCSDMRFSEIRMRTSGKRVPIFPDCAAVDDPFSAQGRCVKK